MLENIRIVLVGTSHPGNIGSAARAMKTMGLSQLYLVAPQAEVDNNAIALAAGASDVLQNATIVETLGEAIDDCGLVIGTSARSRTLPWPMLNPREAGEKLAGEGQNYPVALIFGPEKSGLANEHLQACQFHVSIPANPEYSSLNLAMAVQTLSYEVRMAWLAETPAAEEEYPLTGKLEQFYEHLEKTLTQTGFIIKQHPGQVMTKLRRLYNRARPEEAELNILRGILTATQRSCKNDD